MRTPKANEEQNPNLLNMILSFTCALPVQRGGGRRPGSLADPPQDCSTTEAFSPRTVLTENICRCVQHIFPHFSTTMTFLTAYTIILSCLASAAPQADSWWLGHVESDDVVIAFSVLVLVCLFLFNFMDFFLFFAFFVFGFILFVGCPSFLYLFAIFIYCLVMFLLFVFVFFVGFYFYMFLFIFYVFIAFGACFSLGADCFFLLCFVVLTSLASRAMTPGDSDMWCQKISLSRT